MEPNGCQNERQGKTRTSSHLFGSGSPEAFVDALMTYAEFGQGYLADISFRVSSIEVCEPPFNHRGLLPSESGEQFLHLNTFHFVALFFQEGFIRAKIPRRCSESIIEFVKRSCVRRFFSQEFGDGSPNCPTDPGRTGTLGRIIRSEIFQKVERGFRPDLQRIELGAIGHGLAVPVKPTTHAIEADTGIR